MLQYFVGGCERYWVWLKTLTEKKGSVCCFWYNRGPFFHFTPCHKTCPLVMYQSSCSAWNCLHRDILHWWCADSHCGKCPVVTLSWAHGLSPNGWKAMPGSHVGSDIGIWRDGSSFHPASRTSGQMWVRLTVSHVVWDIAAFLVSSLIVDPCYSWSSSSFYVLLSPTVSVLRLGMLQGNDKEAFLTKLLSRTPNRNSECLLRFPTYRCELKRFKWFTCTLCDHPR